ncbi:MAG TPA: hypothetical protein DCZ13_00215 [Porticoccaceae bacterium]|nr:hypothetical protein [Porticoccaceae bacterium]
MDIKNTSVEQLIESGLKEHLDGNTSAAFRFYNEAFTSDPRNARLNFLIGSLLTHEEDFGRACLFLESAALRDPNNAVYHMRLGTALFHLGDLEAAVKCFDKSLKLDKKLVPAWTGLGKCFRAQKNYVDAKRCFKAAIKRETYADDALLELGFCYLDTGDVDKAHRHLAKADELKASFHSKLAILHVAAHWKNRKRVLAQVKSTLQYAGYNPEHLQKLVDQLDALGIDIYREHVLYQLGVAYFEHGNIESAVETLRKVTNANPLKLDAIIMLAAYLTELGDHLEAETLFSRAYDAVKKQPRHLVELLYRHAIFLKEKGRIAQAEKCLNEALATEPDSCRLLHGLAVLAQYRGNHEAGLELLDRALAIDPQHAECCYEKSLIMLGLGLFEKAWDYYLYRFPTTEARSYLPHPFKANLMLPQPDANLLSDNSTTKKICLLMEQGPGDQIFFARYLPQLQERNAEVVALVTEQLRPILKRSNGLSAVYTPEELTQEVFTSCDAAIGFGDLPLICGHRTIESTPAPLALAPRDLALQVVDNYLKEQSGPLLGLTWEAGKERSAGEASTLHKYVPVKELLDVLELWPGSVVIVQRNPRIEELELLADKLGDRLLDLSKHNSDLEVMLALMARLDHYVSVSNTNLHLYAGLEKPASVLVPFASDWRWMTEGDTSPWFPCFTCYRQDIRGSWQDAIKKMKNRFLNQYSTTSSLQSA